MSLDHLLTVAEAARILNVSTGTVYRKVKNGDWPARQEADGHGIRFTIEHLDQIKLLGQKQPRKSNDRRKSARVRELFNRKDAA